jgi:hypothetical protein
VTRLQRQKNESSVHRSHRANIVPNPLCS